MKVIFTKRRQLLGFLSALLLLLQFGLSPAYAADSDQPPELDVPTDTITWSAATRYGTTINQDSYGDKLRLLVFFNISGGCSNSNNTLDTLAEHVLTQSDAFQVIAIGSGAASAQALEQYLQTSLTQVSDRIIYAWSQSAISAAFRYLRAAGVIEPDATSLTYAVNVVLDEENHIRYAWMGGCRPAWYTAVYAGLTGGSTDVPGVEQTYAVHLSGTFDYAAAREELALINAQREAAGRTPVSMDAGLMEAAMQRAAEIAVYYSHTRPDNSDCFTVTTVSPKANRENIAVFYTSPEDVMNGWMNSEGHRTNLLAAGNQSVGIGCFTDENGGKYWVQLFSNQSGSDAGIPTTPQSAVATIAAAEEYLQLPACQDTALTLSAGETETLSLSFPHVNPEFTFSKPDLTPTYAASSQDQVASVTLEQDGTVTIQANAPGNALISLGLTNTLGGSPYLMRTIAVQVTGVQTIPLWDAASGQVRVGSLCIDNQAVQTLRITAEWDGGALPEDSRLYLACYSDGTLSRIFCAPFQDGQAVLSGVPAQLLQGDWKGLVLDGALRPLIRSVSGS